MPATTTEGTGHGSVADIMPKIINGIVRGENIKDKSVANADIADGAVTSDKIQNGAAFPSGSEGQVLTYVSGQWVAEDLPPKAVVATLAYAATVTTNAEIADIFNLTLTGNVVLANPTGGVDGQTLRWRIRQDATGNRAVTLGTNFVIPSSATSPLPFSTAPNEMDILAATYHAGRGKWDVVAFVMGY